MGNLLTWFLILLIVNECICNKKTNCFNTAKISVITNLHTKICEKTINNSLQEPDYFYIQKNNYMSNGLKIEIIYLDTCGNDAKTLDVIFKTITWTDITCLHPPYFLGFIGPDNFENLKVALKITTAFKLPYIIGFSSNLTYTYSLIEKEDDTIMKTIFELITIFGWKSFIFKSNKQNKVFESIINRFTIEAAARNLCFLPINDTSPYVIYIGEPDYTFFHKLQNSFIIMISEKKFEKKMNNINSNNSFLLLDSSGIKEKKYDIDNEKLIRMDSNILKLLNNTKLLYMIQDSIEVYTTALDLLCKNKNCFDDEDYDKWNNLITEALISYNYKNNPEKNIIFIKFKQKNEDFKQKGQITNRNNKINIFWNNQLLIHKNIGHDNDKLTDLKTFFATNITKNNCILNKYLKISNTEKSINEHKSINLIVSDLTESEWWIMISTVAGIGILIFIIGFIAVYIVFINIREPQKKFSNNIQERAFSLRRVGSEKQEITNISRNLKMSKGLQRRDSRNSIKSNFSDKSV